MVAKENIPQYIITLLLAVGLFVLDVNTELGVASGVNYVCLVLMSFWLKRPTSSLLLAILSTILIIIGWVYSPGSGEVWKVTFNRFYSLLAVWSVALALFFHLRSKLLLDKRENLLKQKAAELESINEQLEAFSYTVSHDLKAPLRALQGFSHNLYEKYNDKFDETGLRWLTYIEDNAIRMDRLIQDVLSFSRLGRSNVQLSLINTNNLVDKIVQSEKEHYNNKLEITIGQLHDIKADHTMFEMLWQNLIGNAFKYSSSKEVIEITINSKELDNEIEYTISDKGAGFDMRYYDKLFKAFHRLHGNDEFDGTGIGLANVKRIIDKHNGTIKAISELEKGTTFIFTLPN